ncbi:MAG TPA: 16S rRNA (guanine(966)-N(2))-methyltransferase RsmD [Thiobacillaceae bacterium]|nr:16S rRNA (guanine(966)-N(2))-methyltransferase RsmD [Thiobacillaceae bacterium]
MSRKPSPSHANRVRIIGGRHRGRVLRFPGLAGLRPTPDRVRETLFNWLGQRLDGLRCLDAFAGSGALGFEAASRGAADVVMTETQPQALASLRANASLLGDESVRVLGEDVLDYMRGDCGLFHVIFLDPPFGSGLLPAALDRAATRLAAGGKIYAEFGERPDLGAWQVLREGRAGLSHFVLLERS